MAAEQVENLKEVFSCFICFENLKEARLCPHCSKICCLFCIRQWLSEKHSECPYCRNPLRLEDLINFRLADEVHGIIDKLAVAHSPGPKCTGTSRGSISEDELALLMEEIQCLFASHVRRYVQYLGTQLSMDSGDKIMEEVINRVTENGDLFLKSTGWDGHSSPKWHVCLDQRVTKCLPFYAYCWLRCNSGKIQPAYDTSRILRRTVLEYFGNCALVGQDSTEMMTAIYETAKHAMADFDDWTPDEQQVYARICRDFKLYLLTMSLLTDVLEALLDGDYIEALQIVLCAKNYAERLSSGSRGAGGVDFDLVIGCYRAVVLGWSERTIKEILAGKDEVARKVRVMKGHLMPCLTELYQRYGDKTTLETIRAAWYGADFHERKVLSAVQARELHEFLDSLAEADNMDGSVGESVNRLLPSAMVYVRKDYADRLGPALAFAREHGILQCSHGDCGDTPSPGSLSSEH